MAASLRDRFEAKVDRSGAHHYWTGSKKADGSGTMKVGGRVVMARRVAWELVHGPVVGDRRILACPGEPGCVQVEHLRLGSPTGEAAPSQPNGSPSRRRGRKGGGTMREIRSGVWELAVTAGQFVDGSARRVYRRIQADDATEAAGELAALVAEVRGRPLIDTRALRNLTMDDAVELFLDQHLRDEKGREERTIDDYRGLHRRWFSPYLGRRLVRDVDEAAIDQIFGMMRKQGLSRSRLNHAKSLYVPFFRWAKSRQIITRNPMLEFQLPTSRHVSKERAAPEVEELSLLLNEAVTVIPDVAPLLVLGAVTGMRRGELVGVRRSRIRWQESRITVNIAVDEARRIKGTKTRRERSVHIDAETLAMLGRHCDLMDDRAAACGVELDPDPFLFSLEPDCSKPLHPDFVTKRVGILKDYLGIGENRPETLALQAEALRLFRQPPAARAPGTRGVAPQGGMSFAEIGRRLKRSERWVTLAIRAAERREAAAERGLPLSFDGSILALRKFTSSELLDAGFNISVVAGRQGHGPQVLVKHYSKRRGSAERKAADHLGSLVHGKAQQARTVRPAGAD